MQYICAKASSRIWALRRLMEMKMEHEFILECYFKEIRSILEYGTVVFHSSLTKRQSHAIESIQRKVFYMINSYLNIKMSYSESCILYCTEALDSRRLETCKTFIKRNLKNPIFSSMFTKTAHAYNVRATTRKFHEDSARTERFFSSPLVYLRRLANNM